MPVILHDKIYIPCEYVVEDEAREKYTFRFYDEAVCRKCAYRRDRHCADCETCEFGGFKGSVCTMNYKTVEGQASFGFPMGDLDRIEDKLDLVFEDIGIVDRTCKAKFSKDFKSKFKMTIDLYPYQEDAVLDLIEYKMGGLQSKPRTGKTTMACNLMTRMPYKVLVIANQKDYLDGFIRELSEHTNIDALEAELGRKLYGFPKKDKDWEDFEIIMVTYQSLIQDDNPKHKWRMDMLRKHRGLCILDEAHKSAATTFAKIMSQITSRMRIQLSGTYVRKDMKHKIVRAVMGPVLHKTDADVMKPKMTVHRMKPLATKAKFTGMGGWSRLTKFLASSRSRNEAIISCVLRDLDKGRSIAIPVYHVEHAKTLVREINYRYGDEIAATFLGGTKEAKKRAETIIRARAGEIKVVVGIRMLIQTGINIAQWNCFVGDTLIPTENGIFKISDLCPERGIARSSLRIHDGVKYAKTALAGHMGKKLVRELTTNSGFQVAGSLKQQIVTLQPDMSLKMMEFNELNQGDIVIMSSAGNLLQNNLKLPYGDATLELDEDLAYLLGAMRGDGSIMTSPSNKWRCDFYNKNIDIYNKVKRIGQAKFGKTSLTEIATRNGMYELRFKRDVFDFLRLLGLHGRQPYREIPSCILQSPKNVQAAYLSGEIDTDGYLSNSQSRYTVGYCGTSKKAMEQMQAMVFHSFGIVLKYNPLKTLALTEEPTFIKGRPVAGKHVCYLASCTGKEANRMLDILSHSVKVETFERIYKFKDHRVTATRRIPMLAEFLQGLKKANGVYHDALTGERVNLQLQRWSVNPSTDVLIADDAANLIAKVYPEEGKRLAKLLRYASIFETVKFIHDSDGPVDTYDFSMENTKHPIFNAGGFVAHNCLYYVQPMNNQPNWEQESNRICTPLEGKRDPLIRFFVDSNLVQAFGCFKSTLSQSLALGHTLTRKSKSKAIDYGINVEIREGDARYSSNDSGIGRSL